VGAIRHGYFVKDKSLNGNIETERNNVYEKIEENNVSSPQLKFRGQVE
jgi:hypothetical protein